MTCTEARRRLDELVDGTLAGSERRETEAHLERCEGCRREAGALRELLERAATLPRSVEPPRDLWAGIESRIEGEKVVRGRFAGGAGRPTLARHALLAAAALALVIASSGLTALFLRGGAPEAREPAAPGVRAAAVAWEEFTAAEDEYRRVTEELVTALEARRGELAPETVRLVEENLEIIDTAIREARQALERDPANAGLATKLTDIYRKKVDFLQAMSRL